MAEAPSKIEMTHSAGPRKRTGSFSGEFEAFRDTASVGKLKYHYSATASSFEVLDIENRKRVPGLGGQMHQQAEALANELGAQRMKTATSQPGFFKKMGYDYTADQRKLNTAMGLDQTKLTQIESGAQESGVGLLMEKTFQRKSSCTIM